MNGNSQKIEVPIVLNAEFLKENPELKHIYKAKKVNFDWNENIPINFKDSLTTFLGSENVAGSQLVIFNPLIKAVCELQELKDFKYDPLLPEEVQSKIIEENNLEHLSFDLEEEVYLFDYKSEVYESVNSDEDQINKLREKTQKIIDKAVSDQHKASHQIYKDAIKVTGGFNSSLTKAKKELKDPYSKVIKDIDTLYKFFKQESDNTKEALNANFENCLKIEQEKKDEREKKKKEKELKQISDLSEENQEQAALIAKQKSDQLYNSIVLGGIGGFSGKFVVEAPTLNKEGLNKKKLEFENMTIDFFTKEKDISILSSEQIEGMKKELEDKKTMWFGVISREIGLIEERAKGTKAQIQVETMKSTQHSMNDVMSALGDAPFQEKDVNDAIVQYDEVTATEDERMAYSVEKISEIEQKLIEFQKMFSNQSYTEEWYLAMRNNLSSASIPKILEMVTKTREWMNEKQQLYINQKQQ